MWIGLIFATAFYLVGFAEYLTYFYTNLPVAFIAAVLAVALIAINYIGVAEASWVQNTIVAVLLVLLGWFVFLGLQHVDMDLLTLFAPEGPVAVLETTGTVYVALIGFALIATAAGEIKRPDRNIPLSMLTAAVVPTVLYILVMLVSTGVLPIDVLADSRVPVADVAAVFLGSTGALAMVTGAVLATVSSANASVLSAGRVSFAMSRN